MLAAVKPKKSRLWSVREVAKRLRVGESTVYNWIAKGIMRNSVHVRLAAQLYGGVLRISEKALQDFVRLSDRSAWQAVAEVQEVQRKQAKREQKRFRAELGNN